MDEFIILLVVLQFIATGIGAYFIAREARKMEIALTQASTIGILLPLVIYGISYSLNPTLEGLTFLLKWWAITAVTNEIAAIPITIATRLLHDFERSSF